MPETLTRRDPFTGAETPRCDIPEDDILQILRGKLHTFSVRLEGDREIIIEALLPHLSPEDVTISFDHEHVLIRADRDPGQDSRYIVPGSHGFSRSFPLPPHAEIQRAATEFDADTLRITIPLTAPVPDPMAHDELSPPTS